MTSVDSGDREAVLALLTELTDVAPGTPGAWIPPVAPVGRSCLR
ncbi:hypothetical protein ACIA8E_27325 [Streptomyces sp. NPDC051664]